MPYKFKTQFYRIPVMGEGDMLTEEQEWIQMSTIDNLLQAAMFGCRKAYLEEGSYSIEWDRNHSSCHLHIRPSLQDGYSPRPQPLASNTNTDDESAFVLFFSNDYFGIKIPR